MANEQNLIPFQRGADPRRNTQGRPRKLVNAMKDIGYTASEVNECMMIMLAMTVDELAATFNNPDSTSLEKACANAIRRSIEKGSLYNIEMILTRSLGKPKETVDTNLTGALATQVSVTVMDTGVPLLNSEKEVITHLNNKQQ